MARKQTTPRNDPAPSDDPGPERTRPIPLDEIPEAQQRWLIPPWLPEGGCVVLEGRKGCGKSHIAAAWAACLTGGPAPPGLRRRKGRVVLWGVGEEDARTQTRPKLLAAGANAGLVRFLWGPSADSSLPRCVLPHDLDGLADEIAESGAAMVLFDPLHAFVSTELKLTGEQEAGRVMTRLSAVGYSLNCVIVLIRHLTKARGGPELDQGTGSVAVGNVARTVLRCDGPTEEEPSRVLRCIATNLGEAPPGRRFTIQGEPGRSMVVWGDDLAAPGSADAEDLDGGQRMEGHAAETILRRELARGPKRARELRALALQEGISGQSLWRAAKRLGVASRRVGYGDAGYFEWELKAKEEEKGKKREREKKKKEEKKKGRKTDGRSE